MFQTAVLCFSSSALPPHQILCGLETKMFLHLFEHVFHVNEINHDIQNALLLSLFKAELTMFGLYRHWRLSSEGKKVNIVFATALL